MGPENQTESGQQQGLQPQYCMSQKGGVQVGGSQNWGGRRSLGHTFEQAQGLT